MGSRACEGQAFAFSTTEPACSACPQFLYPSSSAFWEWAQGIDRFLLCQMQSPRPSLSPAHCSANEPVHPLPQRCCQQPHCVLGSPVGISKWCHLSHKVTASPKASLGVGSPIWPPPPAKGHLPWRMSCCHRQSCSLGWNLQTSDVCNSRGLPCQTQE